MASSNNSRVGYELHTDPRNRAQRITDAPDVFAMGKSQAFPTMAHDADCIVGELVRQYLKCTTTMSGIFYF